MEHSAAVDHEGDSRHQHNNSSDALEFASTATLCTLHSNVGQLS